MPHLYVIGLGSNRPHGRHGRPPGVVAAAIAELDRRYTLFDAAPLLLNPATGGAGRDFANSAALVETTLDPFTMLGELQAIERRFGRRTGRRWGARVLDLDILLWSGGNLRSRRLTIPHPRLAERAFVLAPLLALVPQWRIAGALRVRHFAARLARLRPAR